MDSDEKTQFVVRELRRYRKVDDIIFALAQASGGTWDETAAFVNQVMTNNQDDIESARQPLLTAIGVLLIIAGLGGTLGSMILTLSGWILWVMRIPYAGNILMFLFGLGALIGGLRGLMRIDLKPAGDTR